MRLIGRVGMNMTRDEEGFRTYQLTHHVIGDAGQYAASALLCPGLPRPGERWFVGFDVDIWVWCRADAQVTLLNPREPIPHFTVQQTFSNKPPERGKHPQARLCQDQQIEDPLLEPDKIGGSFVTAKIQGVRDRFGQLICNSAWQMITGPENEWDDDRPQITISQNRADLQWALLCSMRDHVNDQPLWGMPARSILFKPGTFERKPYGSCQMYYTRTLNFHVNVVPLKDAQGNVVTSPAFPNGIPISGWDKDFQDEGDAVLLGDWVANLDPNFIGTPAAYLPRRGADPNNPAHFKRYLDFNGNPTRVVLNGAGAPYVPSVTDKVSTCSQCPLGAPRIWNLLGTSGISGFPLNSFIPLNYTSSCTWSNAAPDGTSATLTLTSVWQITLHTASGDIQYSQTLSAFNCLGANTLQLVSNPASLNAPPSVSISPNGVNDPGNVHVEYYNQANLLVLGIPISF